MELSVPADANGTNNGPHASFMYIAQPYTFEHQIRLALQSMGNDEAKDVTLRLQGVAWIDSVRRALQLPVKTYNTACVYYHRFRLVHKESEYNWVDACAAALFTACKIEDTLKRSREILCAAYNLKAAPGDVLSSDDPFFEGPAKQITGVERLMLESSGFNFTNRYPQVRIIRYCKTCEISRITSSLAFDICLDLYRTYAPMKQTTQTLALACIELALRLMKTDPSILTEEGRLRPILNHATREEIMETLLDLLDLYTDHQRQTVAGLKASLDDFIAVRIALNQEIAANNYPRFAAYKKTNEDNKVPPSKAVNGTAKNGVKTPQASPSETDKKPSTAVTPTTQSTALQRRDGTVRFMMDAEAALEERKRVTEYFTDQYEEVEVEVPAERPKREADGGSSRREADRGRRELDRTSRRDYDRTRRDGEVDRSRREPDWDRRRR